MDRHRTKSSHRDRDRERDYDYDREKDRDRERDYDYDREKDRDRERRDKDRDRDRERDKQYRDDKSSYPSSSSSRRHHSNDIETDKHHHRDKDRHSRREPERDRESRREPERERDRDRSRGDRNNDNNNANAIGRDNRDREREQEYNPKMICKFGEECRRENFYHFKEYAHPHLETLLEDILKSQKESGSKNSRIELPRNYVPKLDKSLVLDQLNHLKSAGFRLPSEAELKRRKDWETLFNPNGGSSASANDNDNFSNSNNNNNNYSPPARIKREKRPVEDEDSKYGKKAKEEGEDSDGKPPVEKEKPNFGLSGKLTEETNTFRGVVIKYSEPQEARKPSKIRWRLYPFKGQETLPVMYIHRQSAYLLGRERKIADIPIDHPSCSKQHAVIQYRLMPYKRSDGSRGRRIKPYIIDLESGNGTFVNGEKIETKRYVELFEKDVLKFGFSSREYVLLHDQSKAQDEDDEPTGNTPEVDEKVRIKIEQEQD